MTGVARDLENAARHIEKHGWVQGHYELNGACCVTGALMAVGAYISIGTGNRDAYDVLALVLGERVPANWNDRPGRTKQEVLFQLRRAAAYAAERGI